MQFFKIVGANLVSYIYIIFRVLRTNGFLFYGFSGSILLPDLGAHPLCDHQGTLQFMNHNVPYKNLPLPILKFFLQHEYLRYSVMKVSLGLSESPGTESEVSINRLRVVSHPQLNIKK